MRLRRLMGVADQIVASRFSSIDLSNKASSDFEDVDKFIQFCEKMYRINYIV